MSVQALSGVVSPGLHHVTAFASDAQRHVDFHTQVLGLRLVKLTVNFDDPTTYHTYFGDAVGTPGSVLTFFPIPGMPRGTPGAGETAATAFSIPVGASEFWAGRLTRLGVSFQSSKRFGSPVLAFSDTEGMAFELIETDKLPKAYQPNPLTDVPPEHAIRSFHSVTLRSRRADQTGQVLTELLGFRQVGVEGERTRYASVDETAGGRVVDVIASDLPLARQGSGSVHHIAFRSSAENHLRFLERVSQAGLRITPPQERCYFRSLYFREPGGVLFEIATDDPGFTVDESPEGLGSGLKLPPWLEKHRKEIESGLVPLRTR